MSNLEDEYRLEYFAEEGFVRKECPSCGAFFWTRDETRELCGEPPCEDYGFIGNPGFDESYSLTEMREVFLSFFEDRDHGRISPYPVAANRWRDDVLLTQASIYDFQPLVTSGKTPPPANPLTVSQPCIRMQDIDNVGKTGRHTMAFEMMAHHAFNAREDIDADADYAFEGEVYWKDQTVAHCDELLAELGADPAGVTYIEDPWVGGGNAGPAIEVIYEGLELATLVFMCMEQDPDGTYELKDGNRYSFMDTYVVDTGYGLERWTWMSQGTPTVYEAIYSDAIAFLKENAGLEYTDEQQAVVRQASVLAGRLDIDDVEDLVAARGDIAERLDADIDVEGLRELMEPLESIYAIADHCRTLAYMFGDEIVPSNVATGYLARMVLRRTKRLVDEVGIDAPLDELVDMQAERLGYQNRDTIRDIVRTEERKYRETLERGRRKVTALAGEYADSGEPIPTDTLIELYDSHGLQPDTVAEIAADQGAELSVPDNFYSLVADRHGSPDPGADSSIDTPDVADLPETEKRYYDDQNRMQFEAVVLDVLERHDGYAVVLDGTMFYPEGGGQPADHGTLSTDDVALEVTDVQETEGVILHHTDADPGTGEFVKGQVDAERRTALMRHHTATHVIGRAAREVLGDHVRQAGAQKRPDSARLDIRHYERITPEQEREIEAVANRLVRQTHPVTQEWLHRNEAEAEHGFDIYQGGVPPGSDIRLIHIDDEDVQACGGIHVDNTGKLGAINLLGTEPVQDGVERLTYAAGKAAITESQRTETALREAGEILDVDPRDVPDTAQRFFDEWKQRAKEIQRLKEELATSRAAGGTGTEEIDIDGKPAVIQRLDADSDELRATANAISEEGKIAVLASAADGSAQFVVSVPDGAAVNAGTVVSDLAASVGGGGGGPPDFAQGGGPDVDALPDALEEAPDILHSALEA
ncbi:MAG: alanyl-tRNA synthetase [uncultured archaeon A07HR60]|nr:MAG: alanyl-tRNA synthetase [uncultured archaeon A07HR60]